jgi:hypothetical protein
VDHPEDLVADRALAEQEKQEQLAKVLLEVTAVQVTVPAAAAVVQALSVVTATPVRHLLLEEMVE